MTVSSKLGELQKIKDKLSLKNIRSEEDYFKNGDKRRADVNLNSSFLFLKYSKTNLKNVF